MLTPADENTPISMEDNKPMAMEDNKPTPMDEGNKPAPTDEECKAVSPKKMRLDEGGDVPTGGDSQNDLFKQFNELMKKYESEKKTIRFAKLSEHAFAPTYGSEFAAGADLYSAYDAVVPAKGKACVPTDIQVEIPHGYYGRVAPRSGLASKNFIDVGAGVVDSDYRGNLKVLLFNFGDEEFVVKKGDRIAQLVCERIAHCNLEEMSTLNDTERGADGFGSTGV